MYYLKITASIILTVHAFHLASLQESTDSPGPTIDQEWLRGFLAGSPNNNTTEQQQEQYYSGNDNGVESIDYSGTASGSMAMNYLEEENVLRHETAGNNGSEVDNTTLSSTDSNSTTKLPELSSTTVIIATTTSTTTPSPTTTTTTTPSPTTTTTTTPGPTTTTTTTPGPTTTTTTTPGPTTNSTTTPSPVTTTAEPMVGETSNTHLTTTTLSPETTGLIPETTTSAAWNTPENVNRTALGNDEDERDFASDERSSKSNRAWAVVLGIGVAVACVGLVAYIILKKKRQRDFSHRKLVEEFHPDPVLRLDNSEPLDLNYGGGAYFNPTLQRDNIQMSNFEGPRR